MFVLVSIVEDATLPKLYQCFPCGSLFLKKCGELLVIQ